MFLVEVTRNRGRGSVWVFPFGAVQVTVICPTLMTLKPKFSRLLGIFSLACLREGDGLLS
jgi:hypothetical protein